MPMLIRNMDSIFEQSDRQHHLFIGFNEPWIDRNIFSELPPSMSQTEAERIHNEWFEKHNIKTELVGPPVGSGYIMGGHILWIDLEEDDPLVKEYEQLFEVDGKSKHPDAYKAIFFPREWWVDKYKAEWDKCQADPGAYYANW